MFHTCTMKIVYKNSKDIKKIIESAGKISSMVLMDFHEQGWSMRTMECAFCLDVVMNKDMFTSMTAPPKPFSIGVSLKILADIQKMAKEDEQITWDVKEGSDSMKILFGTSFVDMRLVNIEQEDFDIPTIEHQALIQMDDLRTFQNWVSKMIACKSTVSFKILPEGVEWVSDSFQLGKMTHQEKYSTTLRLQRAPQSIFTTQLSLTAIQFAMSVASCSDKFMWGFNENGPSQLVVPLSQHSSMSFFMAPIIDDDDFDDDQ